MDEFDIYIYYARVRKGIAVPQCFLSPRRPRGNDCSQFFNKNQTFLELVCKGKCPWLYTGKHCEQLKLSRNLEVESVPDFSAVKEELQGNIRLYVNYILQIRLLIIFGYAHVWPNQFCQCKSTGTEREYIHMFLRKN